MCWLGVSSPYSNVSFLGAGISQASLGQAKVQTQKGRKAPEAGTEGRKKGTSLAAGLGGDYEVENPPHHQEHVCRGRAQERREGEGLGEPKGRAPGRTFQRGLHNRGTLLFSIFKTKKTFSPHWGQF